MVRCVIVNQSRLLLGTLLSILTAGAYFLWTSGSYAVPLPQGVSSEHAEFIEGLTRVYQILIDLDYLESGDVSFPPHAGSALQYKDPEQGAPASSVYEVLQEIPLLRPELVAAHAETNGPQILHNSRGTTYLGDVNVTALRETAPDSSNLLSASMIRLAISTSDAGVNVAYDTESSK
ncbi:hypothetical protein Slin15195_G065250 [Septoria linicola]|uniref:Uncharacterized protein n=1 Tax=Septoria linicola TaxID=215465 RepID=A0A9Q9EIW7_9PEZI|nr:hypothetical protein Slin14017_G115590 [Septoria linicola]USW53206.1 hypothetical protein Slin15195_G065250 [Septoria linicola]